MRIEIVLSHKETFDLQRDIELAQRNQRTIDASCDFENWLREELRRLMAGSSYSSAVVRDAELKPIVTLGYEVARGGRPLVLK